MGQNSLMTNFVLAVDQGTTSSRAIVFNHSGEPLGSSQIEHKQIMPMPGWVEHDPLEIVENVRKVMNLALSGSNVTVDGIIALGLTNQRETTVVWNRKTGIPIHNAIVWQDTRTQPKIDDLSKHGGVDRFKRKTGLPLATFFSASKISWLLENVIGAKESAKSGDLLFGTIDTWLLWNLTGGISGGVHKTDVTNASRTLLMDLETLTWDQEILEAFGIPLSMLPEICSSSEVFGTVCETYDLAGVPISGILGDQQAATFGQAAFAPGDSKNTYGTGNFLIFNTGLEKVFSENGLLTTVAYKIKGEATQYALEGSIAVTGSLIHWLRDNLGIIDESADIESLAGSVKDNGGAYFVPAFSGLFAPYWRPDARGALLGLTRYITKGHIARAALEATAFQTKDVLDALNADSGLELKSLKVDGGMTANDLLMQFQSDILGVPVIRPVVHETTSLGAAYAAGLAVGFWNDLDQLRSLWREGNRWLPNMPKSEVEKHMCQWKKAIEHSLNWHED